MEIPKDSIAIWDERHNLANFGPVSITIRGGEFTKEFRSSEALYQASKFYPSQAEIREAIRLAETPMEAKVIAKANRDKIRKDWDDLRPQVMFGIMKLKLRQNPSLQEELLQTGDNYIYENADQYAPENPDKETIQELRRWAIYKGKGQNWIGEILMALRAELRGSGKI